VSLHDTATVLARELARLDPVRSDQAWLRRAWDAAREAGPIEEAERAMVAYLEGRLAAQAEKLAFRTLLDIDRARARVSDEVTGPQRARLDRDGGLTHEHARDLGYEGLADLLPDA
jgi:hypothetical protein